MIGITRDDDVTTLEIQRHERRNALNTEVCTGIRDGIRSAEESGARVVVITGQGTVFSAGADLTSAAYDRDFLAAHYGMLDAVQKTPLPVIAAVNGPAVGAGVQLAIAADLRVAVPDASFMIPVAKLGLAMDNWTIARLSELAGGGVARAMLMGVQTITAENAVQFGLVNGIGDSAAAHEWAREIAKLAPLSLRHMKLVFNHMPDSEPTQEQQEAHRAAWASADMAEARAARKEKRPPVFRGE
ncbi:enoyl-CoA hydratase [Hoyosella sp. YIM 151337]|uniref:enoyl-CoA hydratase n=1 Tax=Hoyosella sp. YIM 151337 TaxID=2992742 RepID=UPI0022365F89|nr:enoyl-CoA hydratase [Hoyosella sp. YIM 151337]MCW4355992.1 enoyl-CoA hydratase [Hoyosella sp. YIM 151337]